MSSIPRDKKLEIEQTVEQIRLDTGLSYPENELVEIASSLGANVVEAELPDFEGKRVKGFIKWYTTDEEKTANKPYVAQILLNSQQSDRVKNFTLAHEIGHFLLHKTNSFRIDFQDYSKEGDPDNQETEANFFAGTLLMPKDKLILAINNASSLDDVADRFAVSRPAVEARLKWLGYSVV